MFKNILLAVDLGESGSWQRALPVALELCKASSAVLHVISVLPAIDSRVGAYFPADANKKMLEQAVGDLRDFVKQQVPAGVKVRDVVAQGTIYEEILAAAATLGADLVVMASHKPGARDYLLGANAAHVVRHCPRSVMVVRG